MFGRNVHTAVATALLCVGSVGCGGNLDVYDLRDQGGADAGADPLDAGTTVRDDGTVDPPEEDMNVDPVVDDMGTDEPDVRMMDMELNPLPTSNVPQQGPSVEEQILSQCSTIAVKGLSLQLIDQMNCEDPGVMKSFEGAPGISYGAVVFPFQQGPATDTLTAVAANNPGTMPVNSALRTVPQQFLLYEWYNRGLCNANLAASPGRSNHNGGLAVDIGNSDAWRTAMRNASYVDNVSGEPWHFYYSGPGGRDVRNLSVLAFQKLYNLNFPENPIDEDGVYGPMTEGALKASPANGFTEEPRCEESMNLVAYPHRTPLDVEFDYLGDGFLGIRTLAPSGVRLVEYYINGRLAGFADADAQRFETVVKVDEADLAELQIDVIAFDRTGRERGAARGLVARVGSATFFVRPLGGINFEIGVDALPDGVRSVDLFTNGELVKRDPVLRISREQARYAVQLDETSELDVVLFDGRERVVDMSAHSFQP